MHTVQPIERLAQRDSQDSLARSIVREVRQRIPTADSLPGLDGSVEQAVAGEARRNELTLARFRLVALLSLAFVALIGALRPALVGASEVPLATFWGISACAIGAAALLVALQRGWYDTRLRQLVPAADALLIAVPVLAYVAAAPDVGARVVAPGLGALLAIACAFLVFSGSVRLSHSAQRIAAALALADWLLLSWVLGTPRLIIAFVLLVLVGIAILGTRFSSMIRELVAHDIAETSLGGLYRNARATIDAREEVLRIVAHDLRNPISTISMTAEVLRDLPLDEQGRREHLAIITRCSDGMNRMIHDLLDVARMEAGALQVDPDIVEPHSLLNRTLELMSPIAQQQQLTLRVSAEDDLPDVLADADRFLQVFSNLVGNAVKFTPAGGSITLSAQRMADQVRFAVADTGPGIPPDRIARIFERFWQAHTGDRRGIGLGLAIARSIIDAHGQQIGVESPPGGGTVFWFTAAVAE